MLFDIVFGQQKRWYTAKYSGFYIKVIGPAHVATFYILLSSFECTQWQKVTQYSILNFRITFSLYIRDLRILISHLWLVNFWQFDIDSVRCNKLSYGNIIVFSKIEFIWQSINHFLRWCTGIDGSLKHAFDYTNILRNCKKICNIYSIIYI